MRNVLEHKGYLGSVEYSPESEILFGRILGISDRVTYDGASAKELRESFEEAVDDYLETCAQIGKSPEAPCNGNLAGIEISPSAHRRLFEFSHGEGKAPGQLIEEALSRYMTERA